MKSTDTEGHENLNEVANAVNRDVETTSAQKFWKIIPGRGNRRTIAMFSAIVLVAVTFFSGQVFEASDAFADKYPTWAEVEKARSDEKAAKKKVAEIQNLVAAMERELKPLQEAAARAGEEYAVALRNFDAAVDEHYQLKEQIEVAEETAAHSAKQAAILASQLGRSGTSDLTMNLLMDGDSADDLLYRLGTMSQLSNQTAKIFEQADADKNAVSGLADQAKIVEEATEELKVIAEDKLKKAQQAQQAHEAKLASQQAKRQELQAQLTALTTDRKKAESGYQAYLKKVEEDRKREEAARKKAEQEGKAPPSSGPVSSSGWTRPVVRGYLTSSYGNRGCVGPYCGFHTGTDLGGLSAGGGSCGGPILAAGSGRIMFAGYFDSMSGNQVMIDHGGGIVTWYAHMRSITVKTGQNVRAGDYLGGAGDTGAALGCHLHFEFRINGQHYNPVTMMSQRGVKLV